MRQGVQKQAAPQPCIFLKGLHVRHANTLQMCLYVPGHSLLSKGSSASPSETSSQRGRLISPVFSGAGAALPGFPKGAHLRVHADSWLHAGARRRASALSAFGPAIPPPWTHAGLLLAFHLRKASARAWQGHRHLWWPAGTPPEVWSPHSCGLA